MKISKKTRDEAILICALTASTNPDTGYGAISLDLGGLTKAALNLAIDAWHAAQELLPQGGRDVADAEAECLLREGWCPGDEVRRL